MAPVGSDRPGRRARALAERARRSRVVWSKTVRLLPTRFPPIDLFERIADPSDWETLADIESLTNERVRDEIGEIRLVPPEERVSGPGASWLMGAFTHIGRPSRFGDGSFGVYYTAQDQDCALAETCYHYGRFFAATAEPACTLDMRRLVARLDSRLHDLRSQHRRYAELYRPDDYSLSQLFGRILREQESWGIVYDSVRLRGGQCAALFRPRALKTMPTSDGVLRYRWNGERIDRIFDYRTEAWFEPPSA